MWILECKTQKRWWIYGNGDKLRNSITGGSDLSKITHTCLSPITAHSVWNIEFFFVYSDLMMGITNIFHTFAHYCVAPVTTTCCESPDRMSLQVMCRYQRSRGLRRGTASLACWDCGFEYHRDHGCLSLVNVLCFQVRSHRLTTSPKESYSVYCVWVISKLREMGGDERVTGWSIVGRERKNCIGGAERKMIYQ